MQGTTLLKISCPQWLNSYGSVNTNPTTSFINKSTTHKQYLPISGKSDGVMGSTGHISHPLINEVGGHQGRDQAVVGGSIPQLVIAVVAPGIHLSFCIVKVKKKKQTAY